LDLNTISRLIPRRLSANGRQRLMASAIADRRSDQFPPLFGLMNSYAAAANLLQVSPQMDQTRSYLPQTTLQQEIGRIQRHHVVPACQAPRRLSSSSSRLAGQNRHSVSTGPRPGDIPSQTSSVFPGTALSLERWPTASRAFPQNPQACAVIWASRRVRSRFARRSERTHSDHVLRSLVAVRYGIRERNP
jgi:hypothetical protein